jgi:hypothetical protein
VKESLGLSKLPFLLSFHALLEPMIAILMFWTLPALKTKLLAQAWWMDS